MVNTSKDVKSKYLAGGTWKARQMPRKGKASQTPGNKKRPDTCQLTAVAGYSRKFWTRARAYKNKHYSVYCAFVNKINHISSGE